jgi:outer membrane protein assembly factor BamB
MKRVLPFAILAVVLFGAIYLWGRDPGPGPTQKTAPSTEVASAVSSDGSVIDLDKGMALALPKPATALKPVAFTTPDGRSGWVVRFPGAEGYSASLPLSTPAYDNGKLYLGGGFGSTEFYSLNAATGEMIWHDPTSDDGPTSPSVDHGNVAINTQSCSLMVMDENNGTTRWKEWLGDPLVSQPTISKGKVYASFPDNGDNESASADITALSPTLGMISNQSRDAATAQERHVNGYCLLCADVQHGHHLWKKGIPQEVISAPIVVGDRMYFSCYDGTVECLNASTGGTIWARDLHATSAPVVVDKRVIVTVREDGWQVPHEGIRRLDAATGRSLDASPLALTPAPYLTNGGCVAINSATEKSLDSFEGFPDGLPTAPGSIPTSPDSIPTTVQVGAAGDNALGIDSVTGAWAYQGSRVAVAANKIFDAQGVYVNAVQESDGKKLWRMQAVGAGVSPDQQLFSPPALGAHDLYLISGHGELVSLAQADGKVQFAYRLGQPVAFQPILASGNIYITTANGYLICIKTGNTDAGGWTAWGGNSLHNKAN